MEALMTGFLAFIKGKGAEIIIVSFGVSIIRFLAVAFGIIKFGEDRSWKTITKLILLEIPVVCISFLMAVFAGYMVMKYQGFEDSQSLEFWALGWAGLAGILGHNVLSALIKLNFDRGFQGVVNKKLKGDISE